MKHLFYGRFKTAKKSFFSNKPRLKTWHFFAFQNGYFFVVKKRLLFGRYETEKKSYFVTTVGNGVYTIWSGLYYAILKKRKFLYP